MKLTYFQLEAELPKKLAPVYIVSGEELLLKQDALNLIQKTAKAAGFTERVRIAKEAGADLDEVLYHELYSNSLLAEKRLFLLDFRDAVPNKAAGKVLQDYANAPSSDNILLIDIGKIDDKIAKSAWYVALEKIGRVITLWPIPREQLPTWIINRAKKYKLNVLPDAAALLADYVEGNLVAAAQTIEKMYLLKSEQPIDVAMVQTLLTDESSFTVFDFIENLIAGNKSRSLHILETLKQDGTESVLVLWGITRELRMLADLAQKLKQGATYDTLFQRFRIYAKRQQAVRRFLTTFSQENCWDYLKQAADIDLLIKGARLGDAWQALQLFCLRFTPNNS